MAFYLAIDNGGTKTDYVLADDRKELARVRSGTIKRMRIDAPAALANLENALQELTALSGVAMRSIARTCIGTAGESVPLVTDWLRRTLSDRVSGELILVGDVEIALDAAFRGGAGVLVLAGTGSNVAGRNHQGDLVRAGGWGPALADQGSGHRIGLQALRALFLAVDEDRPTQLQNEVLNFWRLRDLDDLVAFANHLPAPDFSQLTELVLGCAARADEVAAGVLRKEGEDLSHLVRQVLRRMQPRTLETSAEASHHLPAVAFAGSIMERVLPVREALIASLRSEFPALHALEGVVDPVMGALWRARAGR